VGYWLGTWIVSAMTDMDIIRKIDKPMSSLRIFSPQFAFTTGISI